MLSKLLDRMERRAGRHRGIRNLMGIVVIGMILVFLGDYILPVVLNGRTLSGYLRFNKSAVLRGEIWRLITFIFVPTESYNVILFAVSLYFYWLMGNMLQSHWGTLRFTAFYTLGMLGAVVSGCITGYATSYYLNMSLMLVMACLYPDMELRLYGLISLKLKWLALLSLLGMALPMLSARSWHQPVALGMALLNVLLFFGGRMWTIVQRKRRHYQWKRNWRRDWRK